MRAALYARVSTEEQAEHNFSLENQADKLQAYCELHDHCITGEYVDAGYSGTTDKRPALARLLKDVEMSLLDVVVVYKLDRFFRSQRHLHNALHFLETHRVGLVSVTESFDTTTPTGKAMIGMLGTFAQLERDTFMERSSDGKYKAVQKSAYSGGPVAYGYAWDQEARRLIIEPIEADIVRHIFAWVIDGLNTYDIARKLTVMGVRTRRDAPRWQPSSVARIIRNPAYKGEWVFGRKTNHTRQTLVTCPSPAIVTPQIWEQAQRRLDANIKHSTRNSKHVYLLSGLIRCQCGGACTGSSEAQTRNLQVRKYKCYARNKRYPFQDRNCTTPPIRADLIESLVWEDIRGFLQDPANVIETLGAMKSGNASDYSAELDRVEESLRQVEDAQSRLVLLYTSGSLPREVLDREASRLEAERRSYLSIKAEIEREQADEDARRARLRGVQEQLEQLAAGLDNPLPEQMQAVIRALVSGVTIGTDGEGQPTARVKYVFGEPSTSIASQTSGPSP